MHGTYQLTQAVHRMRDKGVQTRSLSRASTSLQTADATGCPRLSLRRIQMFLSNKLGRTSVVTMDIQTETVIPIFLPPYHVPDKLADKVELALNNLMEEGIIEPSTATWSSPIVPVVKPSGDIRVCGDYRQLSNITAQIHHYMLELDDILSKIGNSGVLSKMGFSSDCGE